MGTFYVLGIDQSTQGTKAVLLDSEGKIRARYDLPHEQLVNEQGWISHDPEEIYRNVLSACRGVVEQSGIRKEEIACMGITNQRETTLAWDKTTGKALANAIVWQCNRAGSLCERIDQEYSCADMIYERTGLKLSPYYPAAKMAWLMENASQVREAASDGRLAFGTIDSWLIYKLTSLREHKTDYSNASRTQLMDLRSLSWDEEICSLFHIPLTALPEICDSDSVFGETDLGGFLDKRIPICGVLGDSHGALFGHDCRNQGDIKATYGTGSSVMLNTGDLPIASRHGLSTSLAWKVKGKVSYVLEGNINYTGAVITWLKDELGLISRASETENLAKESNPQDKTYIVPAFSGLGAPWWKNDAHALITGMTRSTGKNEIVRAACDCIVYQIHDVISAMRRDTGMDIGQLCVDGGPTRNTYLMQFQSDITNAKVKIPDAEELSVIGASYLAGISAGLYDENEVYKAISYEYYENGMEPQLRREKLAGWEQAISLLG